MLKKSFWGNPFETFQLQNAYLSYFRALLAHEDDGDQSDRRAHQRGFTNLSVLELIVILRWKQICLLRIKTLQMWLYSTEGRISAANPDET